MEFNLNKIQSYKPVKLESIKTSDLNEIGDSIARLTSKRMNDSDRELVYSLVKRLFDYYPGISLEFIENLIYTSYNNENLALVGGHYMKSKTRSNMRKIKSILKSSGFKLADIKSKNKYYKERVVIKGSLKTCNKKRVFHFIPRNALRDQLNQNFNSNGFKLDQAKLLADSIWLDKYKEIK